VWQSPSHAAVAAARLRCPNAHVTIPRLNMSIICMLRLHRCVLAAERSTPAVRACCRAQLVCGGVVRDGCAVPYTEATPPSSRTLSTLCTINSTPQCRSSNARSEAQAEFSESTPVVHSHCVGRFLCTGPQRCFASCRVDSVCLWTPSTLLHAGTFAHFAIGQVRHSRPCRPFPAR